MYICIYIYVYRQQRKVPESDCPSTEDGCSRKRQLMLYYIVLCYIILFLLVYHVILYNIILYYSILLDSFRTGSGLTASSQKCLIPPPLINKLSWGMLATCGNIWQHLATCAHLTQTIAARERSVWPFCEKPVRPDPVWKPVKLSRCPRSRPMDPSGNPPRIGTCVGGGFTGGGFNNRLLQVDVCVTTALCSI